jgi:hypothetical protein
MFSAMQDSCRGLTQRLAQVGLTLWLLELVRHCICRNRVQDGSGIFWVLDDKADVPGRRRMTVAQAKQRISPGHVVHRHRPDPEINALRKEQHALLEEVDQNTHLRDLLVRSLDAAKEGAAKEKRILAHARKIDELWSGLGRRHASCSRVLFGRVSLSTISAVLMIAYKYLLAPIHYM